MKHRWLYAMALLTASTLLLCPALFAQADAGTAEPQVRRISVDEAVKLAIDNNLSLQGSAINVATKKRKNDTSWNQFIPSVTVGGGFSMDTKQKTTDVSGVVAVEQIPLNPLYMGKLPDGTPDFYGVVPYAMSIDNPRWHVIGQINMSLTISAGMFEAMNTLKLDYQGGKITYEKAKLQLEQNVRKLYNQILQTQEQVNLLKDSVAAADRAVATAEANFRAGLAPELTLMQARVGRGNLAPQIDQAQNGLNLLMAQFAMYLGLPYNTLFALTHIEGDVNFVSLDVMDLIRKAAAEKPDIRELRHQVKLLQSTRKARLLSLTPSLSLGWGTTQAFIKDPWKDPWFKDEDDWMESGSGLTIMFGLKLDSLLPWSSTYQAIKDLEDNITSTNNGIDQMVQGAEIEVYNTVLSLEQIRASTEAQRQQVDLAERTYHSTEQAYKAGLQTYQQVEDAEDALRQARFQLMTQHYNYMNGLIDLEYSIGAPFGSLSQQTEEK